MKVIPVMSLKGGTGKTKICGELGRAISRTYGKRIAFLDADWTAPNLHLQLGLDFKGISDEQILRGASDLIQPVFTPEGFPLVSSTMVFPEDQSISMDEDSKVKDILEVVSPGVVNWGSPDYLLVDTPPTTSEFAKAILKVEGLWGVVLVVQPAASALADILRSIAMLGEHQVPICGLVGNQIYVVCPHGSKVELYDLSERSVRDFCHATGVPYLGSIPHVLPGSGPLDLMDIAFKVISTSPIVLPKKKVSTLPFSLLMAAARRARPKVASVMEVFGVDQED